MKIFVDTSGDATRYYETAHWGWQTQKQMFLGLRQGYKDAADQLVEFVLRAHNIRIQDQLVFPILFNYRHSIELFLKPIYMRATNKLCKGHDLLDIWMHIENDVIEGLHSTNGKHSLNIDSTLLAGIKEGLSELLGADMSIEERAVHSKGDKMADIWRYALSKDEQLYFNKNHSIDYYALRDGVDELYKMLDYMYNLIDNFLS